MAEPKTPAFLQNRSVDDFYAKIKEILPEKLDLSEGSHAYNLTRPIAIVAAEICEFVLPEVINVIRPETSYGDFLEGHAKERAIYRKEAVAATGELTITGEVNTVIPKGSLFSTASVNNAPSVDYETMEDVAIPESGTVHVNIQCTKAGVVGNTGINTIVLVSSKLKGITAVTNETAVTGGTEAEDDEHLIARIDEYDKNLENSFTGTVADYKRWAKSVNGVGDASVIPAQDDSGLVTIIITDEEGNPGNEALMLAVHDKIMSPNNPDARLAPPNANLSVIAPSTINIAVQATIELKPGVTISSVTSKFASLMALYLAEALDEEEIKYTRIWSVLSSTEGVNDFKDLSFGLKGSAYGTSNISLTDRNLPLLDIADIAFTDGTV